MNINQKLELTWVGKDSALNIEHRILLNNKKLNYGTEQNKNSLSISEDTYKSVSLEMIKEFQRSVKKRSNNRHNSMIKKC